MVEAPGTYHHSLMVGTLAEAAARVGGGNPLLARPIRFIVHNGNISLYGTVDSAMDKQIAGMRVSSVPGAFSVKNNLVIEGQSNTGM